MIRNEINAQFVNRYLELQQAIHLEPKSVAELLEKSRAVATSARQLADVADMIPAQLFAVVEDASIPGPNLAAGMLP